MHGERQTLTTSTLYLELTARLIEREIAHFMSGGQAAHESFTNVAKLVRNAREALAAADAQALACPPADSRRCKSNLRGRAGSAAYGQPPKF